MAQHDYVIANQSGSAFRADLNNALSATVTGNSGSSAPSTTYAYMIWNDTTSNQRKIRNSANNAWIVLSTLSGGNVFDDDVTFNGASYNLVWDKSDNALEFADNAKCTFGAPDLEIYHSGSHSYIKDTGTGDLFICSDELHIGNAANSEDMAVFKENGAVDLYFNNSTKLSTSATGVDISGQLKISVDGTLKMFSLGSGNGFNFQDDVKAEFGGSGDLKIFHDGSNSWIKNNTNTLIVASDLLELKNGAGDDTYLKGIADGAVELYHDNVKTFETISEGARVQGNEGASAVLELWADQGDDNADKWRLVSDQSSNYFYLQNYSAGSFETSIRSLGDGNVELYYDGVKKFSTESTGPHLYGIGAGSGHSDIRYQTSNGRLYYDSSTRLVKTDISDSHYGIDALKQLKPRKYKRIDIEGTPNEIGFIADEVVSVIPEIVPFGPKSFYTKNDSDTEEIPINVDYRRMTVVLTKALQEAITKIEILETKVAALETK